MSLDHVRSEISKLDREIIALIAKRQELAGKVAEIKIREGIAIHDGKQSEKVLATVFDRAVESRIDPVAVQEIFRILIGMSEDRQRGFSGEGNLP